MLPSYAELYSALALAASALRECSERDGDIDFWNEGGEGYEATRALRRTLDDLEPNLR